MDNLKHTSDTELHEGVSIISVTYNSNKELPNFYASFATQGLPVEVHFVDNASVDKTVELLRSLAAADPNLHITFNDTNIGLAAANNQPIHNLAHDYVAIINPDVELHRGALAALVSYLKQHPNVVAVGPVNVDSTGKPHSSFHRSWTLVHLLVWRVFPLTITNWLYGLIRSYEEQDVLFVSGACLVVRRKDYESIGGYDPEYFLTVEDVCDLCIRLQRLRPGLVVRVIPEAKITHLRSRSTVSAPLVGLWQGARGSIYHFRKHYGLVSGLAATAILFMASLLRLLVAMPLALFSPRYRRSVSNQSTVLLRLIDSNPLWTASCGTDEAKR